MIVYVNILLFLKILSPQGTQISIRKLIRDILQKENKSQKKGIYYCTKLCKSLFLNQTNLVVKILYLSVFSINRLIEAEIDTFNGK